MSDTSKSDSIAALERRALVTLILAGASALFSFTLLVIAIVILVDVKKARDTLDDPGLLFSSPKVKSAVSGAASDAIVSAAKSLVFGSATNAADLVTQLISSDFGKFGANITAAMGKAEKALALYQDDPANKCTKTVVCNDYGRYSYTYGCGPYRRCVANQSVLCNNECPVVTEARHYISIANSVAEKVKAVGDLSSTGSGTAVGGGGRDNEKGGFLGVLSLDSVLSWVMSQTGPVHWAVASERCLALVDKVDNIAWSIDYLDSQNYTNMRKYDATAEVKRITKEARRVCNMVKKYE